MKINKFSLFIPISAFLFIGGCATVQPLTEKSFDLYGRDYCNAVGQNKIDLAPDVSPHKLAFNCATSSIITGQVWQYAKDKIGFVGTLSEKVREQVKAGIVANVQLYCAPTTTDNDRAILLNAFNDSLKPNSVRVECAKP